MIEGDREMSGGLRHHNDEETGRAMRLDTNHPKQDHYSHGGNQCVRADGKGVRDTARSRSQKFLDTTDVVRDVENLTHQKMPGKEWGLFSAGVKIAISVRRDSAVKLIDGLQVKVLPVQVTQLGTVVISGDGAGDQTVGSR